MFITCSSDRRCAGQRKPEVLVYACVVLVLGQPIPWYQQALVRIAVEVFYNYVFLLTVSERHGYGLVVHRHAIVRYLLSTTVGLFTDMTR